MCTRGGNLLIEKDSLWEFVVHDQDENDIVTVPIADKAYSWKHRI